MDPTLPAGDLRAGGSKPKGKREQFRKFSGAVASAMGSQWAFLMAVLSILVWALVGPYYRFSNTWQLVINTGTTIITFLMVFLIQNTQNRDSRAIQLKLDELIRGTSTSRNKLIDLENCSEEEVKHLENEFQRLRKWQEEHRPAERKREAPAGET